MRRTKPVAGQIAALDLIADSETTTTTNEEKERIAMKKATAKKTTPATDTTTTTTTTAAANAANAAPAPVDTAPTTGDAAKQWTFYPDRVTVAGRDFSAGYSIGKNGDVWVFVSLDGTPARIHITADMPIYSDAMQAATAAKLTPAAEPAKKAEATKATTKPEKKAEPTKAATKAATEPTKAATKAATEPAKKAEPTKATTGDALEGSNWKIVFDAATQRTRVIIDDPTAAQKAAIEEARFWWSDAMQSYNKKLTMKARRAAETLAATLAALAC